MATQSTSEYIHTDTFGLGDNPTVFYDTRLVWELTRHAPVHVLPLSVFTDWSMSTTHWDESISPLDLLAHPERYPEHTRRINEADMSYPILVHKTSASTGSPALYLVADGNHRLAKAFREKYTHVHVRFVHKHILRRAELGWYDPPDMSSIDVMRCK